MAGLGGGAGCGALATGAAGGLSAFRTFLASVCCVSNGEIIVSRPTAAVAAVFEGGGCGGGALAAGALAAGLAIGSGRGGGGAGGGGSGAAAGFSGFQASAIPESNGETIVSNPRGCFTGGFEGGGSFAVGGGRGGSLATGCRLAHSSSKPWMVIYQATKPCAFQFFG